MTEGLHFHFSLSCIGEGHGIMIKGSIQEDDITIVNVYAPNIGTPQYIRQTQTDIKGETDSNKIK